MSVHMQVTKRDGTLQKVDLAQLQQRIVNLAVGLSYVDPIKVALRVCDSLVNGIPTSKIDEVSAEIAMELYMEHVQYETLAVRLLVSNMHRTSVGNFSQCTKALYENGRLGDDYAQIVKWNASFFDALTMSDECDYDFTYFGLKTLMLNKYLLRNTHGEVIELPRYMYLRVAIAVRTNARRTHEQGFQLTAREQNEIAQRYSMLSTRVYSHATPTLYNAGTHHPQFASCFLVALKDDSIDGIYRTLHDCAMISKHAGGIGLHMHALRGKGAIIKSTGCESDGLIPVCRVFDKSSQLVRQSGKRPGSVSIYLAIEHCDIEEHIGMRRNDGDSNSRCRELFPAVWVSDMFMEAVARDEDWHLFTPDIAPGLSKVYGDEYVALVRKYVNEGRYTKVVRARELMTRIVGALIETGTPYVLFKDAINRHNNQRNIGVIESSNLCTEIVQVSNDKETAVCNLASICLPRFLTDEGEFDFEGFRKVVRMAVASLNNVIDNTLYPTPECATSNMRHRPIGIGVQGWQTLLFKLKLSFSSVEACRLNKRIFAALYYYAWEMSAELACEQGAYETFEGSPLQAGILHCDTWDDTLEVGFDWAALRENVKRGVRNSLITAIMPTASTAQIGGNTEACEPLASNIYVRRTQAGEYTQVNAYLVYDLQKLGLWSSEMRQAIILNEGSIQGIGAIPSELQERYRTAYEMSQRVIIDQARDRAPYIDQAQSMNLFMFDPTIEKVSSMLTYAWRTGGKNGVYYLRSRPRARATQFALPTTIVPEQSEQSNQSDQDGHTEPRTCSRSDPGGCEMCSA